GGGLRRSAARHFRRVARTPQRILSIEFPTEITPLIVAHRRSAAMRHVREAPALTKVAPRANAAFAHGVDARLHPLPRAALSLRKSGIARIPNHSHMRSPRGQ